MKHTVLFLALLFSAGARAQTDYASALKPTLAALDSAGNEAAVATAGAARLDLIAKKWNTEWATAYYAAYGKVLYSYSMPEGEKVKRDAALDEADDYLQTAVQTLGAETDETHVMRAYIANARLAVDPQARWQKWGKVFNAELDKAKALNDANPRVYLLRGMAKFYTPKMFGGGKKAAKPYFEKASTLYAAQTSADVTKPYWGAPMAMYFLGETEKD